MQSMGMKTQNMGYVAQPVATRIVNLPVVAQVSKVLMPEQRWYGTNEGAQAVTTEFVAKPSVKKQRVNILAIVLSFLMPFALYAVVSAVMSFYIRYSEPALTCFIVFCAGSIPAICGVFARQLYARRKMGEAVEPTWVMFCFLTSLLAWSAAIAFGDFNYEINTLHYYQWSNLKLYSNVDPQGTLGQGVLDAGHVYFKAGSQLDQKHAISFKQVDTYCVAPVTASLDTPLAAYDFWAVGVNCCGDKVVDVALRGSSSSPGNTFRCGQDTNSTGGGGLRVLDDTLLPYYQLAVEQAKSKYHINANNPIFLTWTQDPMSETSKYAARAALNYAFGVLLFLGLQFCLVSLVLFQYVLRA